jgi:hypothetical protein
VLFSWKPETLFHRLGGGDRVFWQDQLARPGRGFQQLKRQELSSLSIFPCDSSGSEHQMMMIDDSPVLSRESIGDEVDGSSETLISQAIRPKGLVQTLQAPGICRSGRDN